MFCPNCGQDYVAKETSSCPNCGADILESPKLATQINVTQEVKHAQGGKVTAVEIGEVRGSVHIDFRDKEIERDRRNKLILLQKVKDFWIKGVLERSIHGALLIEIGKEELFKAVEHPWSRVIYTPDQPNSVIPPDKKVFDIFNDSSQSLLILGEPGSGKTTEMLELAREGIARAEKDPAILIPIVFNLSSWIDPKQTITDWLVRELNEKYQVSKKTGRQWVENRDLMLLMDGLDEVKAENRIACVEAINAFLQEDSCPIAVCSRIQEYQSLEVLLKLNKAILLQPLSTEQVEGFLDAGDSKLSALKDALKKDSALRELSRTPLMLSVMGLAYADQPLDQMMLERMSPEERRKHVFDNYVNKMFSRETRSLYTYTKEQTISWLSWLAKEMVDNGQTIFLMERMQPTWLRSKRQEIMFILLDGFITCFTMALCVGLFPSLAQLIARGLKLTDEPIIMPIISLAIFLFFFSSVILSILATSVGLISPRNHIVITTKGSIKWSWRNILRKQKKSKRVNKKFNDIIILPKFIYMYWNKIMKNFDKIKNWPNFSYIPWYYIKAIFFALIFIYIIFLLFYIIIILILVWRDSPQYVVYMLLFLLFLFFLKGFETKEIDSINYPTQGIYETGRNAIILTLILFVVLGAFSIIVLISYPLLYQKNNFILLSISLLSLCMSLSLLIGYTWGGKHFLNHYALRLTLYLNKEIPRNYIKFLDHCVDRIFLQKVGGGYIFIHRMLLEYFAELEPRSIGQGNS